MKGYKKQTKKGTLSSRAKDNDSSITQLQCEA